MVKDKSTRQSVLELLKKKQELSVSGLKEHLDITEMAVRKHLIKLEGEGLISSRTVRQPMGRPVIFYQLTKVGNDLFPNNYDKIAVEILHDIKDSMGIEAIDTLFNNREQRMRKKYLRKIYQDDPLKERVQQLVDVQEDSGYMAELVEDESSESDGNVSVTFEQFNCPISAIAGEYDKPCECELKLFKEVLGTDNVERVSCIAKGGKSCRYVVKEEKKAVVKSK